MRFPAAEVAVTLLCSLWVPTSAHSALNLYAFLCVSVAGIAVASRRRNRNLRRRKPNHKPSPGRQIILHPNRPVVLRDNPASNRQSQSRPALLGRKMRQEQSLLILRRTPLPTIGNLTLH